MATTTEFPPVRACIFDMDGLLIDSEEAYTAVTNTILRENGRPDLPWTIKAQLQGRPGPAAGKIFQDWAKLPLSQEDFIKRNAELQVEAFKHCNPLPGVPNLLKRLSGAHTRVTSAGRPSVEGGKKVRLALATSSQGRNYYLKTESMQNMFTVFPDSQKVLGDDERIPKGRGKPLPDIFLLALQTINESIKMEGQSERPIMPDECLVFEDSVPGCEAARRAGMRLVWCPHPGLWEVYEDREQDVLAGRTGEYKEDLDTAGSGALKGSPGSPGQPGDGWAERLTTLEDFDYVKYGIDFSDAKYRTESGQSATDGTTDKELEEMTALADGKAHAAEEPLSRKQTNPNVM